MDIKKIEKSFKEIIDALDIKEDLEELSETPRRISLSYEEIFKGINKNPKDIIKNTFDIDNDNLVCIKNIDFYSMCEHHFLPFFGTIDVYYIPDGKILGIGDIYKIIDILASRPQIQERLTQNIKDSIKDILNCKSIYVRIKAKHLCMTMRGVKRENVEIVTTAKYGNIDYNELILLK